MVSKIKKTVKYDRNKHPEEYFKLCQEGNSLTEIATKLGTVKEQLIEWSQDSRKYEWIAVWQRGKEACQAYWEAQLKEMTKKGSGPQIEAIKYILKTQFKEDWADKQETKIEVSHLNKLSTAELDEQISNKIKRLAEIKPDLKLVKDDK